VRQPPPLIVGGGPAGSAAAIALARAGVSACLIERLATPGDAICGGFLSWATLARLEGLGIDPAALGGHRVDRLALFVEGREREVALPARAMGVSRRRLDKVMQQAARDVGAQVRTGCAVRAVDDRSLVLADGDRLNWDSLFLATGKHDLRGAARPHAGDDPELGLRLRLDADPGLDRLVGDRIELHLFARGYVGLVLQEDGSLNACMAVRKSVLAGVGGDPAALFRRLADRSNALADRFMTMSVKPTIDAIGHVPYGWRARDTRPGLFRLGDQAAVIPSLAGEGIGIALASADSAVRHWLAAGRDGAALHQRDFARRAARPLRIAAWAKQLGDYPRIARALATLPGAAGIVAALTRIGPA
jgi:flavin-dependent dehydrogenase